MLSSANFPPMPPRFRLCVADLRPYGLAELRGAQVMFEFGGARLDRDARQQLNPTGICKSPQSSGIMRASIPKNSLERVHVQG